MQFDYWRKISKKEIGNGYFKPHLSLVGRVQGENKVTNVGHDIEKMHTYFLIDINNGFLSYGEKRMGIHTIHADFIKDFRMQEDDPVHIKFDTEYQATIFPIYVEIPEERVEDYLKRTKRMKDIQEGIF